MRRGLPHRHDRRQRRRRRHGRRRGEHPGDARRRLHRRPRGPLQDGRELPGSRPVRRSDSRRRASRPNGAVTHVRTDASGAFSGVVVPQGDYELRVSAPERDDVVVGRRDGRRPRARRVDDPADVGARARRLHVREKRRASPAIPAKLVFKGADGTPDPRFDKHVSATLGGEDVQPETFGGTQRGPEGDGARAGQRRLHGDRHGHDPRAARHVRRLCDARPGVRRRAEARDRHRRQDGDASTSA